MSVEIKVPEPPESVADAVITNWYKQVVDIIGMGEVLVNFETDKVILNVHVLVHRLTSQPCMAVLIER